MKGNEEHQTQDRDGWHVKQVDTRPRRDRQRPGPELRQKRQERETTLRVFKVRTLVSAVVVNKIGRRPQTIGEQNFLKRTSSRRNNNPDVCQDLDTSLLSFPSQ